jgi:hypothetical protein
MSELDESKRESKKGGEGLLSGDLEESKVEVTEKGTIFGDNVAIKFDWGNKWLKGEEYSHILRNADLYTSVYNFKRYPCKTHPKSTYLEPQSKS